MAATDLDPDSGELADYRDLVTSPGWQRFLGYVAASWGAEACIDQIDQALKHVAPEDASATVLQIRAAARQIAALVRYPDERIAQLSGVGRKARPFEALRRISGR
jgi:hypothetical protein